MKFLELLKKIDRLSPPTPSVKTCVRVEHLECRVVPYAISGNAWAHPQLITMSFVPDGTLMTTANNVNVYSNLFATFNAKWAQSTWQNEILQAAQLWAQQANVNFAVVSDNGTAAGGGKYQQGDPGMGDIRIGAYNFGNKSYLAGTYMPPPVNNYSIAGDINFNTALGFNIGSSYDLQTVALHEMGHALGIDHSALTAANMYPSYQTIKRALNADDINAVQSVYGARQADAYGGTNNSFTAAVDLTSQLDPTALSTVVNDLDLTSTASAEYFTVTAPATTDGTLTVNVQSAGLSLLRPSVTVYAADQVTVLGSASDTGYTGSTLSVPLTGVTPGTQYYIEVTGADATAFGTGNFALAVSFNSTSMPAATIPNTQVANGSVLSGGGAIGLAVQDMMEVGSPDGHHHHHHHADADTPETPANTTSATHTLPAGLSAQASDAFFLDLATTDLSMMGSGW